MMRAYDERALLVRLNRLDRWAKTAFATACAQRLYPLYERYARSAQTTAKARRLAEILSCTWDVTSGRVENAAAARAREDEAVDSDFVQAALSAIDRYLVTAESSPPSWLQLRQSAGIEGRIWAATFP
ncbi:DUF416 family protein [Arthrobacter sp. B10-11]|uniref:DUF416 family protein n=1 Tax=Arthrobacter sp. B10-11 TaxID=3081160 RepID=UPI0039892FD6